MEYFNRKKLTIYIKSKQPAKKNTSRYKITT